MSVIAVFGVTGYAGGHIAAEAARRGHQVLGVSRNRPAGAEPDATWRAGSVHDGALVAELAQAADALIIAVPSKAEDGVALVDSIPAILAAAEQHQARVGVVGGAGSLLVSPGGPRLMDTGVLPDFAMPEVRAHAAVLQALRDSPLGADWFYLSPAGGFGSYAPGERTGAYRSGDDVLLVDGEGNSAISGADYAIALVDELERPAHRRTRFTVAY
jgi:putative NADH-flavin reductase